MKSGIEKGIEKVTNDFGLGGFSRYSSFLLQSRLTRNMTENMTKNKNPNSKFQTDQPPFSLIVAEKTDDNQNSKLLHQHRIL